MKTPAISVITPIYNVKPFVSHCVESLMNQTFKDVEFIFVDDKFKVNIGDSSEDVK